MANGNATITVDAKLAAAYNAAPKAVQRKLQSALRQALREASVKNTLAVPDVQQEAEALLRTRKEAELLLKLKLGVPAELQRRFDELNDKRRAASLTRKEHAELLKLIDEAEKLDAERVGYLVELAQLRGVSLPALLKELGLKPASYV